jgi:bacteriorhodopsin
MELNDELMQSATISLAVQIIMGLVGLHGIFIKLTEKDKILTDIMILETTVQFIELCFYIWLVNQLSKLKFEVTYIRYFDWFLSTPMMLISTVFFMKYLNSKAFNNIVTISSILDTKWFEVLKIGISNMFMLLFGFLAEINIISRINGFIFGTIAFLYTFYIIYSEFVENNSTNKTLFFTMFTIWSFYGIAYLFPYITKNVMYNYLDIIAKNFYGFFIYYHILKAANYI